MDSIKPLMVIFYSLNLGKIFIKLREREEERMNDVLGRLIFFPCKEVHCPLRTLDSFP